MKHKKALLTGSLVLILGLACIFNAFAHSGRTDANGGHRDNNNQSGLGSYHYHCGGYPAHLHRNGVCPYKTKTYSSSSSTSTSSKYNEGYDDGYDKGYDVGYGKGKSYGYNKGYRKGHEDGYKKGYNVKLEEATAARKKEHIILLISLLTIILVVGLVKLIKRHRKE